MTPEDFTEEQRQIARTASDFVRNEVLPEAEEIEAKHFDVTRALLKKAGDLGLMAVDIPEEYGGLAMDKVTSAIVADHLSQLGSFSVAFSAHVGIGTLPIVWYGTDAQKQKFLPQLGHRRLYWCLRALRGNFRFRCNEHSRPRHAFGRRQALPAERREDVDQQRRLCRPVHCLREGRWRKIHRVPDREGHSRSLHRRGRAQARHPWLLHLPAGAV